MRILPAMQRYHDGAGVGAGAGVRLPFTAPVPAEVQDQLLLQQAERLQAYLPLLCLVIAANSVAMALAVYGGLPLWQQLGPPILIVGTCLITLLRGYRRATPTTVTDALRRLHAATWVAGGLGLVAGLWCVSAFVETERYYCMVAPVFIGIAALVSATCLFSAPRAAIAAMTTTIAPIVAKMMTFNYLCVRAMAFMMIIVTVMQAGVVLAKFRETVGVLVMQSALNRLAATDALTGLDNRHAFTGKLRAGLASGAPLTLVMADLDGFKAANDRYGHLAGDAILVEVGKRLRQLVPYAESVARLGGDEFALLFRGQADAREPIHAPLAALRAAINLPVVVNGEIISVGISFGTANTIDDSGEEKALMHAADVRLYADKAARRPDRRKAALTVAQHG